VRSPLTNPKVSLLDFLSRPQRASSGLCPLNQRRPSVVRLVEEAYEIQQLWMRL
jgi:hypothetical protein